MIANTRLLRMQWHGFYDIRTAHLPSWDRVCDSKRLPGILYWGTAWEFSLTTFCLKCSTLYWRCRYKFSYVNIYWKILYWKCMLSLWSLSNKNQKNSILSGKPYLGRFTHFCFSSFKQNFYYGYFSTSTK